MNDMKKWLKISLIVSAIFLILIFSDLIFDFSPLGISVRGYTCPDYEGFVDCMPTVCSEEFGCENSLPEGVMCSGDYYSWTVKNCNIDYTH